MPIYAREPESKFTPAPEGIHPAVCVDVVDLGTIETTWGPKQKVELRWQLDLVNEETGKRFEVRKWYTNSLSEKANLRKDLENFRGRRFTPEELKGFDLERVIGACCQLQIVHTISDEGRTWANVAAIVPLGKGMAKLAPENYVRQIDREAQPSKAASASGAEDCPF